MLFATKSAAEKRSGFRAGLNSGKILKFPGAHAPLVSMEIERQGFEYQQKMWLKTLNSGDDLVVERESCIYPL